MFLASNVCDPPRSTDKPFILGRVLYICQGKKYDSTSQIVAEVEFRSGFVDVVVFWNVICRNVDDTMGWFQYLHVVE